MYKRPMNYKTLRYRLWKRTLPEFRDLAECSLVELSDYLTLVEEAEKNQLRLKNLFGILWINNNNITIIPHFMSLSYDSLL